MLCLAMQLLADIHINADLTKIIEDDITFFC